MVVQLCRVLTSLCVVSISCWHGVLDLCGVDTVLFGVDESVCGVNSVMPACVLGVCGVDTVVLTQWC